MQPAVHSHRDHLIALKRKFCPTVCQGSTVLLALVWRVALGTRPVVHPAPPGVGVFGGCQRACQPTCELPRPSLSMESGAASHAVPLQTSTSGRARQEEGMAAAGWGLPTCPVSGHGLLLLFNTCPAPSLGLPT